MIINNKINNYINVKAESGVGSAVGNNRFRGRYCDKDQTKRLWQIV